MKGHAANLKQINFRTICAVAASLALGAGTAWAQVVLTGRVDQKRSPGSDERIAMSAVYAFASPMGLDRQAMSFRTWETAPAGWYFMTGGAGNYTMVFSTPGHFMRPILLTNIFTHDGEKIDRRLSPNCDYAVYHEGAWDREAAYAYYQTFVATGKSLTNVGFRVAHDGVDGWGPASQNVLLSVHRKGEGTPDKWPQVGPTVVVPEVDSGGAKNYIWSAGWDSGEAPLKPGETYAIRVKPEKDGAGIQPFWLPVEGDANKCYRVGPEGGRWVDNQLWMSIGTDSDGLLIPYNKKVQKQFVSLTKFGPKWSQTYVAQGRGLASVIVYAATSGVQPSMNRQRVAVRVRRGGPDGPQVGIDKIAIGNANYTGDASWGVFGVAFAPGEVRLTPGETYAIEFESIENYETLHGFVNIKGQVSDDKPGFNPYRKHPRDSYEKGTAWFGGTQKMDYDLDMQIIEYESTADDWEHAVDEESLIVNGDMQTGDPEGWKAWSSGDQTTHDVQEDPVSAGNRFLRVGSKTKDGKAVDGGYVQRVENLSALEAYRLSGQVRCSWPLDEKRQCRIGYDPTGQIEDPDADTIIWTKLPGLHGAFVPYASEPFRPREGAISVWLRASCEEAPGYPFRADFDDFALNRVRTEVPGASSSKSEARP